MPRNRYSVDHVLSEARNAVVSARAQRDQLAAELRSAEADNQALRQALNQGPPRTSLDAKATERVRSETLALAIEPMAELLDQLTRSLAIQPDPSNPWFKGTLAILARTHASLKALGVQTTGDIGQPFDPTLHEAIGTLATPDVPAGCIVDRVKTGLVTRDGTLIRAASVVVAEEPS